MLGWLRRYSCLKTGDVSILGLNAAALAASVSLNLAQFPERSLFHWGFGLLAIVLPSLLLTETLVQSRNVQSEKEWKRRWELAQSLFEDACRATMPLMTKVPDRAGALVFLPEGSKAGPQMLIARLKYNKQNKPDRDLRFERWQGCAGHGWARGDQMVADLAEVSEQELAQTWKLTPEQIAMTRHLRLVVSTPIRADGDPEKVLGMLAVDSEVDNDACGLKDVASLDEAWQLALLVGRILQHTEIV